MHVMLLAVSSFSWLGSVFLLGICISAQALTEPCPEAFGSNLPNEISDDSGHGLYLNLDNLAACSGNVTAYHYCYYDVSDESEVVVYFMVFRGTGPYSLVEGSVKKVTRMQSEVNGFGCDVVQLTVSEQFQVQENDVIAACTVDVSSSKPLPVHTSSAGGYTLWSLSGFDIGSSDSCSSVNTISGSYLEERDDFALHLYADIQVAVQPLLSATDTVKEVSTLEMLSSVTKNTGLASSPPPYYSTMTGQSSLPPPPYSTMTGQSSLPPPPSTTTTGQSSSPPPPYSTMTGQSSPTNQVPTSSSTTATGPGQTSSVNNTPTPTPVGADTGRSSSSDSSGTIAAIILAVLVVILLAVIVGMAIAVIVVRWKKTYTLGHAVIHENQAYGVAASNTGSGSTRNTAYGVFELTSQDGVTQQMDTSHTLSDENIHENQAYGVAVATESETTKNTAYGVFDIHENQAYGVAATTESGTTQNPAYGILDQTSRLDSSGQRERAETVEYDTIDDLENPESQHSQFDHPTNTETTTVGEDYSYIDAKQL